MAESRIDQLYQAVRCWVEYKYDRQPACQCPECYLIWVLRRHSDGYRPPPSVDNRNTA